MHGTEKIAALRGAPVVFWAAIGASFLALVAYIFGSWMLSPDFRPVPVGPDPLPHYVWLATRITEVVAAIAIVVLLSIYIFRPLIKTGKIGLDGMLVINFFLLWWTDPIDNYINFSFMYNGYTLNMGSWANYIPGWSYPNHENFPEPLLIMGGFYPIMFMLYTLAGCWLMRKTEGMRLSSRLFLLFFMMAMLDLIQENLFMRTGVFAYPGVIRSMSIFPGTVYQWPLYEAAIFGIVYAGFTCLRYFKDDKGQTFVEKGVEKLRLSPGRKQLVSFLAIAGFLQPFFLIGYYLPYNAFVIHADTFPAYPSYLRTGICGEGTKYACPSKEWVPIPTRDSKLFIGPDDPRLPKDVRDAQGISASGKDPYVE